MTYTTAERICRCGGPEDAHLYRECHHRGHRASGERIACVCGCSRFTFSGLVKETASGLVRPLARAS